MKIAVFGKTGQVASALAQYASDEVGIETIGREDVDFSRPDDVAAATEQLNAHAIINAVAYTAVDAAETDEALARLVNATSVARMAEIAARRGLPLVHISTDYVFSGSGSAPRTPDAATDPLGVYGATKLEGERSIEKANGSYVILRTSWVFSANGTNFVKTMLRLSETRDTLGIVSDQVGGPTPADSIATAAVTCAQSLLAGSQGGTFHFAGAPDVSWADFAREIFRQAGRPVTVNDIPTTAYPTPAQRPLNSRLDCESLRAAFGIQRPDWRKGLTRVLEELT